ncbi:hypothetical protein B7494_g2906 [Chlorociboria aeruginascens]|nr:hypothetical protein B7494_g2906 [Chlorociboria aeruginascens]
MDSADTTGAATDSTKATEKKAPSSQLQKWTKFVTILFEEDGDEHKFPVHKEFACFYSPVFDAAFSSASIEGQTQTYRLEDTSVGAICLLIEWLYSREIATPNDGDVSDIDLVYLWVLADKLFLPGLQNLAIDAIRQRLDETKSIPSSTFEKLYELTSTESPLRRLAVDQCVCYSVDTTFKRVPSDYPHEMLIDIATAMKCEIKRGINSTKRIMSNYYVPFYAYKKKQDAGKKEEMIPVRRRF